MKGLGKWVGTAICLGLLFLVFRLDRLSHGSPEIRNDVPASAGEKGETLPDFTLPDLDGRPVSPSDFRGQRVLLAFERSLDW